MVFPRLHLENISVTPASPMRLPGRTVPVRQFNRVNFFGVFHNGVQLVNGPSILSMARILPSTNGI
jgi:hypothetical protein